MGGSLGIKLEGARRNRKLPENQAESYFSLSLFPSSPILTVSYLCFCTRNIFFSFSKEKMSFLYRILSTLDGWEMVNPHNSSYYLRTTKPLRLIGTSPSHSQISHRLWLGKHKTTALPWFKQYTMGTDTTSQVHSQTVGQFSELLGTTNWEIFPVLLPSWVIPNVGTGGVVPP